jgi:hypothetical protein
MTTEGVAFVFVKFVKHTTAIPRRKAPEWLISFLPKTREQGMPDARCTRDLVCNSA